MICPKCGTNNEEDCIFCVNCEELLISLAPSYAAEDTEENLQPATEEIEEDMQPTTEQPAQKQPRIKTKRKKTSKNRMLMGLVAVAVILLVTICTIIGASVSDNGYIAQKNSYGAYIDNNHVVVIYNDRLLQTDITASSITSAASSIDGKVYAFLTGNDTLCVVRGKRILVISEDADSYCLSSTGSGVAYETTVDGKKALYVCNTKTGRSRLVDDSYNGNSYQISPDGKAVLYNALSGRNEGALYLYRNRRTTQLSDKNLYPAGLSNNGKYIYAYGMNDQHENVLYRFNSKGASEQIGALPVFATYFFNEDHTQVLFHGADGQTYLAVKDKDAHSVSNAKVELLMPENVALQGNTYPVKNLHNHVYVGYDSNNNFSAWYIHKNPKKSCSLMSRIHAPVLDSSARFLYFLRDGDLYCLKISKLQNAAIHAKRIAFDVKTFVVTSDRGKVYFIADNVLYSANGKNGNHRKVVASQNIAPELVLNRKNVLFYIQEGNAYACRNGRKSTEVLDQVKSLKSANGIVYLLNADKDIYVSTGSTKIKLLLDTNA